MSDKRYRVESCPFPGCTDGSQVVSVDFDTPLRPVTPEDPEYDPCSPFVKRIRDPQADATTITHQSGTSHLAPGILKVSFVEQVPEAEDDR